MSHVLEARVRGARSGPRVSLLSYALVGSYELLGHADAQMLDLSLSAKPCWDAPCLRLRGALETGEGEPVPVVGELRLGIHELTHVLETPKWRLEGTTAVAGARSLLDMSRVSGEIRDPAGRPLGCFELRWDWRKGVSRLLMRGNRSSGAER